MTYLNLLKELCDINSQLDNWFFEIEHYLNCLDNMRFDWRIDAISDRSDNDIGMYLKRTDLQIGVDHIPVRKHVCIPFDVVESDPRNIAKFIHENF